MNMTNITNFNDTIGTMCQALNAVTIIKLIIGIILTLPCGLVNGFFLIIIYQNRRTHWAKQLKYVTYLIASDCILGFLNTFLAVNRFVPTCLRNRSVCIFSEYAFISSQLISLHHILAVCVDRLFCAFHLTQNRIGCLTPYVVSISLWVGTLLMCGLPYIIWLEKEVEVSTCVSPTTIFNDTPPAAKLYFAILLATPWFLTNILYVVLCGTVYFRLNRVQPFSETSPFPREASTSFNQSQSQRTNDTSSHLGQGRTDISVVQKVLTKSTVQNVRNVSRDTDIRDKAGTSAQSVTEVKGKCNLANISTRFPRRDGVSKTVLITVGVLLLVLDGSIWPIACHFMGRLADPDFSISSEFYVLLYLNQIINPFVYTLRIRKLREAQVKIFRRLCGSNVDRR